jgi:hypothetical protein
MSFEAPIGAGASVEAPIEPEFPLFPAPPLALFPMFAPAGPTGVLALLASLLAPLGLPLPALDMPVPPPPAANAKLGIKISATVVKELSFIAFLRVLDVERDARQRARGGHVPRSGHAGIVRVSALYCAVSPPSTMNSAPVVNEDSPLARKRIVLATSSALRTAPR